MSNPGLTNDVIVSILVVAQDGHFRDSVVALLRTLPGVTVAALDVGKCRLEDNSVVPDIVLLDLEACGQAFGEALVALKGAWAGARYVVLVDNVRQIGTAYALGADYALTRSAPASELLLAIRRLRQVTFQAGVGVSRPVTPSLERFEPMLS